MASDQSCSWQQSFQQTHGFAFLRSPRKHWEEKQEKASFWRLSVFWTPRGRAASECGVVREICVTVEAWLYVKAFLYLDLILSQYSTFILTVFRSGFGA
jgi:hypothetical protein